MAAQFNFQPITRGDTLLATGFTLKTTDPVAVVDLTGAQIKIAFKKNEVLIEKTIDNGITVADPTTGYFILDDFIFDYYGKYDYDIQITFVNGDVSTMVEGYIDVKKDVSRYINI